LITLMSLAGTAAAADLTGMLAAVDLADQLVSAHCRKRRRF
jgi:hypothetical protein